MRRLVDHVLAALPFEQEWFAARGISSSLVGHPFFDELVARQEAAGEQAEASGDLVAPVVLLLPGSRGQEIEANLGTLLNAAERVRARCPHAQPVIGALHARHAARIQQELDRRQLSFRVETGKTRQLIGQARVALAVSGSVSLELLAAQVPTVIVYRVSGFAYVVQSWFRHARFITLVNLLAVDEPIGKARGQWLPPRAVSPADPQAVYPEYLCVHDPAELMAADACRWLEDGAAHRGVVARLKQIAATVSQGGSADRAAAAVIEIAERPVSLCHPGLSSGNEQAA